MHINEISSRLTDIEKKLFENPSLIKEPEIFDFFYYLIRVISKDSTKFPMEIVTHCPDILEATLDKIFREIEV